MQYEWDEQKNKRNINKHGVDFSLAAHFEWSEAKVIEDDRLDYGENRFIAHGLIGVRLYAMAFTIRGETVRIISLRKTNKREVKFYERTT
jgi:uncharacterized DUF497 family protein